METNISEELRLELLEEGLKQEQDASSVLISHIEDEKMYSPKLMKYFQPKIMEYIDEYIKQTVESRNVEIKKYKANISSMWLNRQKTGEFSPPHMHPHSQISFVIYLDFPEEITNEKPRFEQASPGSIEFYYGTQTNIDTDYNNNKFITDIVTPLTNLMHKPKTGEMIIFPSYLVHFVAPFYTEGIERISLAGNISIMDVNEKTLL
jgi:uncharacterized protein (TIGR02466 family)